MTAREPLDALNPTGAEAVNVGVDKSVLATLPSDPNDLLTPEQHADLSAGLARLANQRRRVEAESRCLPMH